jgi:hypothetical protein
VLPLRALLMLCLLLSVAPAFAWTAAGHQATAIIGEFYLTPKAAAEVHRLLALENAKTMAAVSLWADTVKDAGKASEPVHSVWIPLDATTYDKARDCADGRCAVEAINDKARKLADRRLPEGDRLIALKYLIHLVGDLHQPLHATQERGHVTVLFHSDHTNLHKVWDKGILAAVGVKGGDLAGALLKRLPPDPGPLDPALWAMESHEVAVKQVYVGPLAPLLRGKRLTDVALPSDYGQQNRAIVETQVLRAGVRLAALLNSLL